MADRFESQLDQGWEKFAYAVQSKGASAALELADGIEFFLNKLSGIKGETLDNYRVELLKNPERFLSEFGISYGEIYSSLASWNYYATTYLKREFLDDSALKVFFGFNRDPSVFAGYTDSRFLDDVKKALDLLGAVGVAAKIYLPPAKEEVREEEEVQEKKEEIVEEEEQKEAAPKKAEEPAKEVPAEKSPEGTEGGGEETKEEKGPVVPDVQALKLKKSLEELKSVDEGDRQFRQEIVRMQQVSLRQLAQAYGVPEGQQDQFVRALAADITPFITHEMLSLAGDDLANALKSTSTRYSVYLKVLLRAQQSPQFQVALQQAAKKYSAEGRKLSTKEVEGVAEITRSLGEAEALFEELEEKGVVSSAKDQVGKVGVSQIAKLTDKQKSFLEKSSAITPYSLVESIREAERGVGLGDGEIQKIVSLTKKNASAFEVELKTILISGAGLTDSQVRGIFSRLQSYALLRSNIEYISPEDFERVFGSGLGVEKELILGRIQKALEGSGVSWGRIVSSYVRSAKIDIVERTGNTEALHSDSTREPSQFLIDQAQKEVFSRGFEAVSLGLYASRSVLEKQLGQLEKGGEVDSISMLSGKKPISSFSGKIVLPSFLVASSLTTKPSSMKDLKSALEFKSQGGQKIIEFMREKKPLFSGFAVNGFTAETYDNIHWSEKAEYLRSIFLPKELTPSALELYINEFFVEEQTFLYEIGYESVEEGWFFYQPSGEIAYEEADFADEIGAGENQIRINAAKNAALLQQATEARRRKRLQAVLALVVSTLPGGAVLKPLVDSGIISVESIRKLPGGEKLVKYLGKLADPDEIKKMARNALMGASAMVAATTAAIVAFLAKLLTVAKVALVFLAGAAGFLIAGPIGALLAGGAVTIWLFGSEISSGLLSLFSSVGAGAASAWGGLTTAIGSGWASAIAGTKAFFGGLLGVTGGLSMVTGPVLGATMTVAAAGIYLNQDVIKAAFLTERTAISYGISSARGLQVLGCWPTSGRITGVEEYCDGGQHKTMGNSRAIDISAPMGSPVYAPFAGTATFYRDGSGLSPGYGNHVVLKADNGVKLILGHLLDFGNFQSFEGGSAQVGIGDVIGRVDNTGNSTGNHLHYEVWGGSFRDVVPNPDVGCGAQVVSSCTPGATTQ